MLYQLDRLQFRWILIVSNYFLHFPLQSRCKEIRRMGSSTKLNFTSWVLIQRRRSWGNIKGYCRKSRRKGGFQLQSFLCNRPLSPSWVSKCYGTNNFGKGYPIHLRHHVIDLISIYIYIYILIIWSLDCQVYFSFIPV